MAIINDNKYYEVDEYGIPSKFKTFLTVDTQEEMESIDTTRLMQGSRVTVIGTGSIYRLSSTGEWVKFYPSGEQPTPPTPTEPSFYLSPNALDIDLYGTAGTADVSIIEDGFDPGDAVVSWSVDDTSVADIDAQTNYSATIVGYSVGIASLTVTVEIDGYTLTQYATVTVVNSEPGPQPTPGHTVSPAPAYVPASGNMSFGGLGDLSNYYGDIIMHFNDGSDCVMGGTPTEHLTDYSSQAEYDLKTTYPVSSSTTSIPLTNTNGTPVEFMVDSRIIALSTSEQNDPGDSTFGVGGFTITPYDQDGNEITDGLYSGTFDWSNSMQAFELPPDTYTYKVNIDIDNDNATGSVTLTHFYTAPFTSFSGPYTITSILEDEEGVCETSFVDQDGVADLLTTGVSLNNVRGDVSMATYHAKLENQTQDNVIVSVRGVSVECNEY